jgi:hypothetical protein
MLESGAECQDVLSGSWVVPRCQEQTSKGDELEQISGHDYHTICELTTSRPQHLAQPAAKCGRPAAKLGTALPGSILALLTRPYI